MNRPTVSTPIACARATALAARFALAACAGWAAPALAQPGAPGGSLTLYGILDGGLEYADNGRDRGLHVESGLLSSSRLGLRGSEDLGRGVRAVFALEAGIEADTGALDPYTPAGVAGQRAGFNRQSYAGVEGGFGQLTAGRQRTPIYQFAERQSVFGRGLAGSTNNLARDYVRRVDHSIQYQTPRLGGLRAVLLAGAGREGFSAPTAAGRFVGVGVQYERGPLLADAAWHRQNQSDPLAGTVRLARADTEWALGATYGLGPVALNAAYFRRTATAAATGRTDSDLRSAWVGARVALGADSLLLQVGQLRRRDLADGDGRLYAVGYLHPLSRRTTAYASYGVLANDPAAGFSLRGSGDTPLAPAAAGANVRSLMLGVRHTF